MKFEKQHSYYLGKCDWTWKFYPRKVNITIGLILIAPITILFIGLIGFAGLFGRSTYKVQSWSSYRMKLKENEIPSKWDAYKKF